MARVTDITGELRLRRMRRQFARLLGLAEDQERRILADPMPWLVRAAQREAVLRRAMEEADHVLAGDYEVLEALRRPSEPSPPDLRSQLVRRIERAREVLGVALRDTQ